MTTTRAIVYGTLVVGTLLHYFIAFVIVATLNGVLIHMLGVGLPRSLFARAVS